MQFESIHGYKQSPTTWNFTSRISDITFGIMYIITRVKLLSKWRTHTVATILVCMNYKKNMQLPHRGDPREPTPFSTSPQNNSLPSSFHSSAEYSAAASSPMSFGGMLSGTTRVMIIFPWTTGPTGRNRFSSLHPLPHGGRRKEKIRPTIKE